MKNNNELKASFIAQYWGQPVLCIVNPEGEGYKYFALRPNHSPHINRNKQPNNDPCKCGS